MQAPGQVAATAITNALNILHSINPNVAQQVGNEIGATGPGNPNGVSGPTTVVELVPKDGKIIDFGSTGVKNSMALNIKGHAGDDMQLAITLYHEYLHIANNAPGGALPTSRAAILAQHPDLSEDEAYAVAACNHAAIHAISAAIAAQACSLQDSCSLLVTGCSAFVNAYKSGQGWYAACTGAIAELSGSAPSEVIDAGANASAHYQGVETEQQIRDMSNCCHFASEGDCE